MFVKKGFSGTSIGNIAKLAKVNHSLIFHHFTNKEQLWVAVKQNIVEEANQKRSILPNSDLPFLEFLDQLFTRSFQFYRENQDLIRLLNWQRLERDTNPGIGITNSGDMIKWMDAFTHYQTTGAIKANFNPTWIVTFILSIISAAALDANVFLQEEKALKDYLDFCKGAVFKVLDT